MEQVRQVRIVPVEKKVKSHTYKIKNNTFMKLIHTHYCDNVSCGDCPMYDIENCMELQNFISGIQSGAIKIDIELPEEFAFEE